jgi:hypothetical protein
VRFDGHEFWVRLVHVELCDVCCVGVVYCFGDCCRGRCFVDVDVEYFVFLIEVDGVVMDDCVLVECRVLVGVLFYCEVLVHRTILKHTHQHLTKPNHINLRKLEIFPKTDHDTILNIHHDHTNTHT